jgi:hypothetical protein
MSKDIFTPGQMFSKVFFHDKETIMKIHDGLVRTSDPDGRPSHLRAEVERLAGEHENLENESNRLKKEYKRRSSTPVGDMSLGHYSTQEVKELDLQHHRLIHCSSAQSLERNNLRLNSIHNKLAGNQKDHSYQGL